MGEQLTLAQVQFNLYRPNRWVTVGAGTQQEVTARAASGYYGELRSPAGDMPVRVRVHHAASELEMAAAMQELGEALSWTRENTG
ncbi:MAG TPA: hypothetical protein VFH74_15175 [Gaiellales bacterium]|nr:hypothetical protein [Gaiellales bacterium]